MPRHSQYGYFRANSDWASRFLDTVGDGSGSSLQNVDGSITPVVFKVTAAADEVLLIDRMLVDLADTGSLDSGAYGNNIVLTTGIEFGVIRADATEEAMTDQHTVKTNADWVAFCHDVDPLTFGLGDEVLTVRYTFAKDGAPVKLNPGDSFFMRINDDLTGLSEHHTRLGMVSAKV